MRFIRSTGWDVWTIDSMGTRYPIETFPKKAGIRCYMIFLKDAHFSAHGAVLPISYIYIVYILCNKNILLLLKKWTFFLGPFPPKSLQNSPQTHPTIQRGFLDSKDFSSLKLTARPWKVGVQNKQVFPLGFLADVHVFWLLVLENVHPGSLT